MLTTHLDTSNPSVPAGTAAPWPAGPGVLALIPSGQPAPGGALARQLGVSRAAVVRQIAALRAAGVDIGSGRAGYRLARPVDWVEPAAITAALPDPVRRRVGRLENHWRVDSTQAECLRRAGRLPDRSFVFADWQVAGRGRRGRQWLSPPAANLQVSCFKRFSHGYHAMAGLSLAAGVAVADALVHCGVAGARLKWPNDLVHGDAKLGGILVELGGEAAGPCHAVIGIGINVRVPEAMQRALARPCADLAGLLGDAAPTRNALAVALVARLVDALDAFAASGFAAFADAWAGYDALAGRRIRVDGVRGAFDGIAEGVDAHGSLRVRSAGKVRSVDAGEVTVRAR